MSTYSQLSRLYRRAICTGESMNMVRRHIPPAPPMIPAAANRDQRRLEACFLLGWVESTTPGGPTPSFLSATHPAADGLAISVSEPAGLLPLLRRVLPRWSDGRLVGVPGLRVYLWRDYLELRALDVENEVRGRIRLYGLNQNRTQGKDLLARASSAGPACLPLHTAQTLTQDEVSRISSPTPRPDTALSFLLRRFPLWRTAEQVSLSYDRATATVRWRGAPDSAHVAAILRSTSCGAAPTRLQPRTYHNVHEIAFSAVRWDGSYLTEPWDAWENVHGVQTAGRHRPAVAPCSPPMLTPETWEHPEMRDALAAREVSTIYKLLRRRGVPQRQIAAMTGQSQSEVSEILKGRQVMAYDVLMRIADGLGVPRKYMGLAYDEVRVSEVADEPENVKRRKFLAHAAAVAVGAHVVGGATGSWRHSPVSTPAPPSKVGVIDVRQVEAAARALRALDAQYGNDFVRDAAVAQTLWAERLLANAEDVDTRVRLMAAIADLDALGSGRAGDSGKGHDV